MTTALVVRVQYPAASYSCSFSQTFIPDKPLTMSGKSNAAAAPHDPTRGETSTREFSSDSLAPEQSRQLAGTLLNSKELLRDIRGLTPEDQTTFVDKADQVCPPRSFVL